MNKRLISLVSALTLSITLPAFAGPDWEAIERARKNKRAQTARLVPASAPDARPGCPPEAPVLPLDHGPRAQSTPYVNQQLTARYQAEVLVCQQPAK